MLIGNEFDTVGRSPLILNESIDISIAKMELLNEECGLSHGPKHLVPKKPLAVDYLCQMFGFSEEKTITDELRIPICAECIEGLYSGDWVLLYCITCNNSQWVYKPESKLDFNPGVSVVWMDECPKCPKEDTKQ